MKQLYQAYKGICRNLTGVFSLCFVVTTNCLVETLSVHLATIPYHDIDSLSRPKLSSFGVTTSILYRDIVCTVLNFSLSRLITRMS